MEKGTNQNSDGIRLTLTVTLCVLCFVAGAAYTKADLWLTMRHTPAIKIHTLTHQPANDQAVLAAPEQSSSTEFASLISPPPPDILESKSHDERPQKSSDEWQTVRMRVTAYCPCPICCGQYSDGMTACGHVIKAGDTFVAADKRYAFGTEMMVPGYSSGQIVKVFDRGGAIRGDRIDVFFPTHQEALEWGVKHLDVKIRTQ